SFRSAILSGKGLNAGDPVVRQKKKRGAAEDDLSSVAVSRSEPRTSNQRDDDRHRLEEQTARARFDGEEHDVEVVNLSGGGAMIRCGFSPRLWERVDLIFAEGGEIECAVRWIRDNRVGLEFAHETRIDCDPDARDALLLDVIHRSFPDVALLPRENAVDPLPVEAAAPGDDDDAVANSRRTERRHPLVWMGEVYFAHNNEKVRLRNISERGALIESPAQYPIGVELLLDLGDAGQHFATVSWACGDKSGLKFNNPFDLKLLGSAKPEVAPQMMTRPGPAGRVSVDQDNPWAEEWKRQSLEELRDDLEGYLKR
ncbi:MAG TPA: PilZ domain-containing protein, partial [Sphingomicrobium sp.]|nr:PilZ domain-containing protein [Sphingomicrobium sp.]